MNWLYKHWYKSTIFLALPVFVFLILRVRETNFPLFLIWLQFVIYLLHQFEEYVLPGGFIAFFNTNLLGSSRVDFPLTIKASFWINIPLIFIAYPLSALLADYIDLSIGIWTAYFSIINAASHVGMFFKFGYNPGMVLSLSLNIPIGIYTVVYFYSENLISTPAQITGLLIGLLIQAVIMIYGFKVLKPQAKN